jgi:Tripartite tricarboxylate transporter family receptor
MCQKRFIIQQECCMRWSLAADDHRQFARQRLDASMAKAGFLHPAAAVRAGKVEAAGCQAGYVEARQQVTHVPYRGDAPAITDLIGGQVQVYFGFLHASLEHIKTGKVRALGVTTGTRSPVLPDVPTVAESVPGYEALSWNGTPVEIMDKLNKEINRALVDAKIRARFNSVGAVVHGSSPAEFGQFIADDTEKWAKVIRLAGIKANRCKPRVFRSPLRDVFDQFSGLSLLTILHRGRWPFHQDCQHLTSSILGGQGYHFHWTRDRGPLAGRQVLVSPGVSPDPKGRAFGRQQNPFKSLM